MYVSTPERDAAAQRADDERRERCAKQLARYQEVKLKSRYDLLSAAEKKKQEVVIAFQTGKKIVKKNW